MTFSQGQFFGNLAHSSKFISQLKDLISTELLLIKFIYFRLSRRSKFELNRIVFLYVQLL